MGRENKQIESHHSQLTRHRRMQGVNYFPSMGSWANQKVQYRV
jgi:hypothetical protein